MIIPVFSRQSLLALCLAAATAFGASGTNVWTNDIVITNAWHLKLSVQIPPMPGPVRGILVYVHGASGNSLWRATTDRNTAVAFAHGFASVGTLFTNTETGERLPIQFWKSGGEDDQRDSQALEAGLADLASNLGRPELARAPIAILGFSQGAAFAMRYAQFNPGRTVAFAHDKFGHHGAMTNMRIRGAFAKVPGMLAYGTKDGSNVQSMIHATFRTNRALGALWALVEDYGMNHRDGSYGEYFGLQFLDKVIEMRLPERHDPFRYVLTEIKEKDGWVGDNQGFDSSGARIDAFSNVPLNRAREMTWLPTRSLARVWSAVVSRRKSFDITSPAHGPTLGSNWVTVVTGAGTLGPFQLSGTPLQPVREIEWFRDGISLGVSREAPFSFTLDHVPFGWSMVHGLVNGTEYGTGAAPFVGKGDTNREERWGTAAVPECRVRMDRIQVGGRNLFLAEIHPVHGLFGYVSTNGTDWSRFGREGVVLTLSPETVLTCYGTNIYVGSGPRQTWSRGKRI